jgi:hypothetical protein
MPTGNARLVLTTFIIVLRVLGIIQLWHEGRLVVNGQWWREIRMEDFWLLHRYLFFITACVLYLYIVPTFCRLTYLGEGLIEPYATANDDALLFIQKGLFAASASSGSASGLPNSRCCAYTRSFLPSWPASSSCGGRWASSWPWPWSVAPTRRLRPAKI